MAFNLTDLELVRIPTIAELRMKWIQKKLDRLSKKMEKLMVKKMVDVKEAETPNEGVHVFYFAWFRYTKHMCVEETESDFRIIKFSSTSVSFAGVGRENK